MVRQFFLFLSEICAPGLELQLCVIWASKQPWRKSRPNAKTKVDFRRADYALDGAATRSRKRSRKHSRTEFLLAIYSPLGFPT